MTLSDLYPAADLWESGPANHPALSPAARSVRNFQASYVFERMEKRTRFSRAGTRPHRGFFPELTIPVAFWKERS